PRRRLPAAHHPRRAEGGDAAPQRLSGLLPKPRPSAPLLTRPYTGMGGRRRRSTPPSPRSRGEGARRRTRGGAGGRLSDALKPDHARDVGRRQPGRAQGGKACILPALRKLAAVLAQYQVVVEIDRRGKAEQLLQQPLDGGGVIKVAPAHDM